MATASDCWRGLYMVDQFFIVEHLHQINSRFFLCRGILSPPFFAMATYFNKVKAKSIYNSKYQRGSTLVRDFINKVTMRNVSKHQIILFRRGYSSNGTLVSITYLLGRIFSIYIVVSSNKSSNNSSNRQRFHHNNIHHFCI